MNNVKEPKIESNNSGKPICVINHKYKLYAYMLKIDLLLIYKAPQIAEDLCLCKYRLSIPLSYSTEVTNILMYLSI